LSEIQRNTRLNTIPVDNITYVSVILPLAIPKVYSYSVPIEFLDHIKFGIRVEVPLRNKNYAGLVVEVSKADPGYKTKHIHSVIDELPIITEKQYLFWKWISEYYCCSLGEVMNVALPSGLKLSSETRLLLMPNYVDGGYDLTDKEFLVTEALTIQEELSIEDVKDILAQKTVYPVIKKLLEKRVIYIKEELKEKYKPKKIGCVQLTEYYQEQPDRLTEAFDLTERSERQTKALLAFMQLSKQQNEVPRSEINKLSGTDSSVLRAMEKKGIFEWIEKVISRIEIFDGEVKEIPELNPDQSNALEEIHSHFTEKQVVLLKGITGSGKTHLYISLIKELIEKGQQVLYLLPEIALTAQLINRLKAIFGDEISLYHSKMNNHERVELWKSVVNGQPIVLGARSALFLPFQNLKLVIVDEEHDPSFKQQDPNPRYHARDAAIQLMQMFGGKVLLGTATPSMESYYNGKRGKFGFVELNSRYGKAELPAMTIIDLNYAKKTKKIKNIFSFVLLEKIKAVLNKNEQVLIFRNRRGYAPSLRCQTCGWHAECLNCDVSLTMHRFFNELRCHYCGFRKTIPPSCSRCGSPNLDLIGFGTEKIVDLLSVEFPQAKLARMDYDAVKTKKSHERIIEDFEDKKIDILVGTQMITKGLDFEHVGLVAILDASKLLSFPDFRSAERAFQLMIQVAGRAGRKNKGGEVLIQTSDPTHPVIQDVLANDFNRFAQRELIERKQFIYPPFFRLIVIHLKHKKNPVVQAASIQLTHILKADLGNRVIGPSVPMIARVRNLYQRTISIKMEKNKIAIKKIKDLIIAGKAKVLQMDGMKSVRINIDIDPN
jgi:primosomal protein N' (replication factor Y)